MKYLRQVCILLLFSCLGELLHGWLPLPVPAALYGLVLLFLALQTGLVPLAAVQETGQFLLAWMPVLFVAPAVGLLDSWTLVAAKWLPVLVLVLGSTVLTFGVAGRVTQWLAGRGRPGEVPDARDL